MAPSNLVIVWLNSGGSPAQAVGLYRHIRFLVVKAAAPLTLTEGMRPKSVASANPAERKQAAVAEPAMLQHLERAIQVYAQRNDWRTPSLCAAFTMATSVVRFAHTGRPSFLLCKAGGCWCRCYRGKSKAENGRRKGFVCFAPNVMLTHMPNTPLQILYCMWHETSRMALRGGSLSYLAFELPRGTQVMYSRFQDILREALAPSVTISQAPMIVTY